MFKVARGKHGRDGSSEGGSKDLCLYISTSPVWQSPLELVREAVNEQKDHQP